MGAGASVDEVTIDGELAKVLSASEGDLAAAAEKVNREIVRVVPKTRSGRFDPEHGERAAVLQVVERANLLAQHGYAVSWAYYNKPEDGARRDGEDLLEDTRRLEEDFTPDEPPRCALPEGASVGASVAAIVELAKRHGRALIESLKGLVQDAGGSYVWGPRKKEGRIREKAEKEYGGDVARVVDVERATGIFDSVDDLSLAITRLKRASRRGDITIRRCKDHFGHPFDTGYRDLQFNIELDGFVGELQLNLRKIIDVKKQAHAAYEVERVLKAGTGRGALERAVEGPGLESEQVLRLTIDGGRSVDDAFGSLAVFEAALARALPRGCVVANVYSGDQGVLLVRLGLDEVAALAQLRDEVILGSAFEEALRRVTPRWERPAGDDELRKLGFEVGTSIDGREFCISHDSKVARRTRPTVPGVQTMISVDRAAFLECYSRAMMCFTKLTPHQREKLQEVRAATVAVLLSPAGGGKTFVAIQRVLAELRGDAGAVVLFAARNTALALFVCKWLVAASRKSPEHVVDRVRVLVAPFEDGPRRVRVEGRRLVLDAVGEEVVKYALVVVDEAHHLVNDAALRAQLADVGAAQTRLLLLADASQATATLAKDTIARSLVELPQEQDVVVATLSEVVRSTKRIVAGAAAFQLEAGRKAETSTHSASAGPPLVARVFTTSKGDDAGETYAREVVEALTAIRRQLVDLEDLDDRVAVVGSDEAFVEKLREPLAHALGGFELVDAATASAALPRDEERSSGSKPWLVVDSVENMDGLERLVVICVGLDQVIDRGAGVLETRSRLYRAMTRAQLAVAVVNEVLPGGWLEFLGCVKLDGGKFDDVAERENWEETAADDVVGAAEYPLHATAKTGNVDAMARLLDGGAAVDQASGAGETPLCVACQNGRVDVARLLLDKGADVHKASNKNRTPLHAASYEGHIDLVRLLLANGASLDVKDTSGSTPVADAKNQGHMAIVALLEEHYTAKFLLHATAKRGDVDAVAVLLDDGAAIDQTRGDGRTALFSACKRGHFVAELLLERDAAVDKVDKYGQTPLFVACAKGNLDAVRLLLDKGADVNRLDEFGVTPLCVACNSFHVDAAFRRRPKHINDDKSKDQIDYIEFVCKPVEDLLFAALQCSEGCALTPSKSAGHNCDRCGQRIAADQQMRSCRVHGYDACEACAAALSRQMRIRKGTEYRCSMRRDQHFSSLFRHYGKHNGVDEETLVFFTEETTQELGGRDTPRSVDLRKNDVIFIRNRQGLSKPNKLMVQLLLNKGAKVDRATKDGSTPLSIAKKRGHSSIVSLLEEKLEQLVQLDLKFPLHAAARTGDVDAMTLLLDDGSEVDAKQDGATPLFVACDGGHVEAARLLLDKGAEVDQANEDGSTPLYITCKKGSVDVARLLVDNGADTNSANTNGVTPLHAACEKGHVDAARLVLEKGAVVESVDKSGRTPLWIACKEGHVGAARLLLHKRADVNRATAKGTTSLGIAQKKGHSSIVALLEDHLNPLHAAANTGDIDAMNKLLDGGAAVDQTRGDGETPLWIACLEGRVDAARLLLERGAEVNRADDYGQTPLWVACLNGHIDVARLCLKGGANIDLATQKGTTPLAIAQKKGHATIIAMLEGLNDANKQLNAGDCAVAEAPTAASIDVVVGVPEEKNTLDAAVADAGARPAPVAEKAAADADVATTPSEAEPMKVLQSIWDASAVATASRGDLRFMPFFELDPSKLAELRTLRGHSNNVECVAVFPDGRRVVSCDGEVFKPGVLKVWDVATGECVATLEGHSYQVNCVAISPDGRRIVSGSDDNTLKIWDVATGKCVATLRGHSKSVWGVAISPDGRRVVSGGSYGWLKVWDVATGKCVATLEGHSSNVYCVAMFPDGRRVVSGSADKVLAVWDVATGKCVAPLRGHSDGVYCVAVFPDGRRIASGSDDGTLKVWDVATGECVATLKGLSGRFYCVAVFPDGRRVVSASEGTLKVWDVATGECVATLAGSSPVAVFPDGRRLVSASGKTLKLWGPKT